MKSCSKMIFRHAEKNDAIYLQTFFPLLPSARGPSIKYENGIRWPGDLKRKESFVLSDVLRKFFSSLSLSLSFSLLRNSS